MIEGVDLSAKKLDDILTDKSRPNAVDPKQVRVVRNALVEAMIKSKKFMEEIDREADDGCPHVD